MYEWLFAGAIVFTAAVLQSAVGFGFAVVATPLLLLVFDSRDVIQISMLLSASIALLLLPKIIKEVDAALLKRLFVGSLFGIPIGLFFFAYVSLNIIKLTVGIMVILIGAFLFFWGFKNGSSRPTQQSGDKTAELSVGLLSGVLTAGIGMPGIPLSIYFNIQNTEKAVVRSTTLAFFIGVYTVTVIAQMLTVKFSTGAVTSALLLAPALLAGIVVGNILHYRINQRLFQLIINIVLLYTGISMVVKVL